MLAVTREENDNQLETEAMKVKTLIIPQGKDK